MTDQKIEVGTIVHHPKRPAWGPAKALEIGGGGNVTLYFRDLEEVKPNDAVKTISTSHIGLEIADEQTDFMLDNLPVFENGKFKGLRKPRLSLDQAVQAFIDKQPAAFENQKYIDDQRATRLNAHELWMDLLGNGQGQELLDSGDVAEARKRLLKIDAKLDLLTSQERATLKRGLKNDENGQFIGALMAVTAEPEAAQAPYQELIDAVDQLMETEPGSRTTNWSILTQFPFIACPEYHFEFKPTVVQKCAARLNYDLRYSTTPNWWTYDRLLYLATNLKNRLETIGAKDFIDVHWFMSVIATV